LETALQFGDCMYLFLELRFYLQLLDKTKHSVLPVTEFRCYGY